MVDLTLENAAVGVVAFTALNLVAKAALNLYKTFLRPAKNLKRYGKWAVVTGATGKNMTYLLVCYMVFKM